MTDIGTKVRTTIHPEPIKAPIFVPPLPQEAPVYVPVPERELVPVR